MATNSTVSHKTVGGTLQCLWRHMLPSRKCRVLRWAMVWVMAAAMLGPCLHAVAGTTRPYYQRTMPISKNPNDFSIDHIDLRGSIDIPFHLPSYPTPDASGVLPDSRPLANSLFDARAAAAVAAAIGDPSRVTIYPAEGSQHPLLEKKTYDNGAPSPIYLLTPTCLAAMAYLDYFPNDGWGQHLRDWVSQAITNASSGWCGSFGPGVTGTFDFLAGGMPEGNYDMNEMHILPLIYRYYDELTPEAREKVIMVLLKNRQMQRPNEGPTYTSGAAPNDWSRAGYLDPLGAHFDIPETENHVLMIATARYLTNQLLYQRLHDNVHDNRRNGDPGNSVPCCTELMLDLLRNILVDDFTEYNAKSYQEETRWALVNLYSYAYDDDVRLAARMVLDYISAHFAVSSDDLRRLVPFRRRNEDWGPDDDHKNNMPNSHLLSSDPNSPDYGFMDIGLTAAFLKEGTDPMARYFALLAGNTRAFEMADLRVWPGDSGLAVRPWPWGLNGSPEMAQEPLCDYRLPPSIHDLFVNDTHRRFFQRLHRFPRPDVPGGQFNCDNNEIYSGSPSYLITAGGSPAMWVIPGRLGVFGYQDQNLGVAVPTSFMPTRLSAGINPDGSSRQNDTRDLIQFSRFSSGNTGGLLDFNSFQSDVFNYGVAPDFACGYHLYKPSWVKDAEVANGRFTFVNKGPDTQPAGELAGFFLAIHQEGEFALMEAFDTWRHPEVTFGQFTNRVLLANQNFGINNNQGAPYTTQNGNRIYFEIVVVPDLIPLSIEIARIKNIEYGTGDAADTLVNAGQDTGNFLSGTIMQCTQQAVVTITNPFLGTAIRLDMSDKWHPKRTDENGVVETAGWDLHQVVWVDFDSPPNIPSGPDGDFFHPFKTLAEAVNKVAVGGTIKIVPGAKSEPMTITKAMTLKSFPGSAILGHN